jgi:FtsP/CotA-like multicopper oxidase with cupredoxin domain
MEHEGSHGATTTEGFPTDASGLPAAQPPEIVDLSNGDRLGLRIAPVAKRLGDATVRMLAYNGSIPGPTLRVPQGAEVVVDVENQGDLETTVHWHGLRLENPSDGTRQTQDPIPVGGSFSYRVQVPDPGVYWYHPHIREDYGQEMGLYGNVLVVPSDPDHWGPVNREQLLTLDDVLVEDGRIAPFSRDETNYVAMGRFGNVMLVGGETDLTLSARAGEVLRLYLTNTANTRVFNVAIAGARMKLVGGDSGRCEHEEHVESVVLAPSERTVVEVIFDRPGRAVLENRTPAGVTPLATIVVEDEPAEPSYADQFERLRTDPELAAERERLRPFLEAEPGRTLAFVAEMDMGEAEVGPYVCPMHPEVVSDAPGRCPECGMKLLSAAVVGEAAGDHEHHHDHPDEPHHEQSHEHHHHEHAAGHSHEAPGGVEWEDDMVEVNRMTTPANTRWKVVDRATGAENEAIDWRFRVGDRVKIRLVNEMESDHPMHHPFHVHGAGRFLVLARDGVVEHNLVWKDTVLLRTGETVEILLEVTNPGVWMAHCHIAEHHEGGMMFSFSVDPAS